MLKRAAVIAALAAASAGPADAQGLVGKTLRFQFSLQARSCYMGTCTPFSSAGVQEVYFGTGGNVYVYDVDGRSGGERFSLGKWSPAKGGRSRWTMASRGAVNEMVLSESVQVRIVMSVNGRSCAASVRFAGLAPGFTADGGFTSQRCEVLDGNPNAG